MSDLLFSNLLFQANFQWETKAAPRSPSSTRIRPPIPATYSRKQQLKLQGWSFRVRPKQGHLWYTKATRIPTLCSVRG